ncbi:molybdopterin molybdotransferase MoeA [Halocatena pleomorpha]|uniref:Molybdopterin molybdenumtransferase MoeA n=1 Tax=Halocatena pleomorpha TaxID=1785090 RepID=A0A3P3RGX1_9EURY|nr:molybdopterin molybdotransferase MoeA [Halocatena pleomorpha]RRJ32188.1 molybdopterin molybdenumtransferase MoeA [Halocatena pleomorpha]
MTDASGGFSSVTRVEAAQEQLFEITEPLTETERLSVSDADRRVLSAPVRSNRNVPAYRRVAMDGWAVRARDTFGANDRSPVTLRATETVGPNSVVPVDTGQKLPEGADAVVQVEKTERHDEEEEVEIFGAVAGGENVAPVGEDVETGQRLFDPGHQLRPSDLGLLKSTGVSEVSVYERPTVGVIPTGEELVQSTPEPGETIETNGQTVAQYVDRWGGTPIYRDIVVDEFEALRAAIERDLTADIVVTTGGTSVGERDLVPSVISERGTVIVHGVALSPGHPVALGVVDKTPVVMLPGYPVACIVTAVQFLRPLVKHVGHYPCEPHPTTEARLAQKIHSEPGVRTYARVTIERSGEQPIATTTYASGAGVLSSVAFTDGWVVVPESREGIPEDELVTVENWEAHR